MLRRLCRAATALSPPPSASVFRRAHYSDKVFVHRDTPVNSARIKFAFSATNAPRVVDIIAKYPAQYKKAAIIPLLHLAQEQLGWTSLGAMNEVARIVEVPPMRVYEVATFYTMFNREPVGKYFLQVCTTTPCELCGSTDILNTIRAELGIGVGETTPDKKFTLVEVECAGACVNAPVLAVNDDYYEDLTPNTARQLLQALARDEKITPGPMGAGARRTCEPKGGLTSLVDPPTGPGFGVRADL